jgi:hypothetical protein
MNESQGSMNSQSMLKTGDQPRVTERDMSAAKAPPSVSYVRYQQRGAMQRSQPGRASNRR